MSVKDKKAHHAVMKARVGLLIEQAFFGSLALHLQVVERPDENWWKQRGCNTPTMAVDGFSMYYYPDFVNKLKENELMGVVAHEVMHCAYKHMTRRGGRDPIVWNIAGDFVINLDLKAAGFTLPAEGCHDEQFKGMSTDEVYAKIMQNVVKIKVKGLKGDGKGGGKGDFGDEMDPTGCGAVLDCEGTGKADKAKSDALSQDWDNAVRAAVQHAKDQNAGNTPGWLERLVLELKAPKVNWRDLTRQWIDGHMRKDYTWSRPNRRFVSGGLILPGFIPDALHHLVMVTDVSGSISDKILQACGSEVAAALDEGTADRLTVMFIDTEIRRLDEYTTGDTVKFKMIGGGGTDFRPAFDWVNKFGHDVSALVYLTDMMPCTWDLPSVECPVLWAGWGPASTVFGQKPPFGQVIHIDDVD